MNGVDFELAGFDQVNKLFKTLPAKLEKRVLMGALRAAGRVIIKDARTRIPDRSGRLSKALGTKTASKRQGATLQVGVIDRGKGADAFYAHLVEFGTKAHTIPYRKKSGKLSRNKKALSFGGKTVERVAHPGSKAHPFLRPAFDATHEAATNKFAEQLHRGLIRELKKR